eukprot:12314849-Alexandrium_andersonii.AAC.1
MPTAILLARVLSACCGTAAQIRRSVTWLGPPVLVQASARPGREAGQEGAELRLPWPAPPAAAAARPVPRT